VKLASLAAPPHGGHDVAITGRRRSIVRGGVVLCAAVATLLCIHRLDQVMGLFDFRADRNAAQGYLERVYADDGVVHSRRIVEEARANMPDDAAYAVVVGPGLRGGNRFTPLVVGEFLNYFLLPRRQVGLDRADWVFCYGCDTRTLGRRFVQVARAPGGVSFGRLVG
jgi:hypothetical protein